MTDVPSQIETYIGRRSIEIRAPAWLRVDPGGRVVESGGDLERYGLEPVASGDLAEDRIDVLCGLVPTSGDEVHLPLIELSPTCHAELWLFGDTHEDWAVFLAPSVDVGVLQSRQQDAHERALIDERLARVESDARRRAVLAQWNARQGVAVFSVEAGEARALEPLPDWLAALPAEYRTLESLAERFPVLEHFLEDARGVWSDPTPRWVSSGLWTERPSRDHEEYFEATAGFLGTAPVIVVQKRDPERDERISVLQRSRSLRLNDQTTISRQARAVDSLEEVNDELERRVAERTADLERTNRELRARELRLKKLTREIARLETRERQRIAGLLHDGVGQLLATAQIRLGALAAAAADDEHVRSEVERVRSVVAEAIGQTRTMTADLGTPILHQLGIDAALESLSDRYEEEHNRSVVFAAEGPEPRLGSEVRQILYESARELVFNAVKHAESAEIRVRRATRDGWTLVSVEDDGAGFDAGAAERSSLGKAGGYGLFHVRERIEAIGGTLEIEAAPGLGARLCLRVPHDV